MKHILFLCSLWALSCNSSQKAGVKSAENTSSSSQDAAITYAQTITQDELKEYLYTYASDEFEGRETGEPGQKKAVAYLKAQYQKIGVPAAKGGNNYFQKVPLEIALLPEGSITVQGKGYPLGEHILAFHSFQGTFDEVVYVGYGIEEDTYSDYKGLEVAGKVVLAKFGEPMNPDGTSMITGTDETSKWSNMSEALDKRMTVAQAKGAKALLFYDEVNFPRYQSYFNTMKRNASGRMELADAGERLWSSLIDTDLAQQLLPTITKDATPKTLVLPITFALDNANGKVDSENVVAILKGSEKPNEYVVISSHLDHIGVEPNGDINNGADDDGSGTVALLEIAQAFKKAAEAGHGPKRSIVFLHVTGEEKGLLGSQYYTDYDPIFPLENTVANLNIDMIGRIDPKRDGDRNYIYLIGSDKLSTELHELSEAVNEQYTQLELDYTYNDENDPNRFYYRSDHYNFAKNNIPIIFYFNGTHADYHRPGDTPDKINYDLLENRTRLIFHTAWETANRDKRVLVDKAGK